MLKSLPGRLTITQLQKQQNYNMGPLFLSTVSCLQQQPINWMLHGSLPEKETSSCFLIVHFLFSKTKDEANLSMQLHVLSCTRVELSPKFFLGADWQTIFILFTSSIVGLSHQTQSRSQLFWVGSQISLQGLSSVEL